MEDSTDSKEYLEFIEDPTMQNRKTPYNPEADDVTDCNEVSRARAKEMQKKSLMGLSAKGPITLARRLPQKPLLQLGS